MIWLDILLGLGVSLSAALLIIFSVPRRGKARQTFRAIPAIQQLRRAVGLAVEDGSRLHISIGKSPIHNPTAGSALVGLTSLERVAQQSQVSDRPPVATSGDGVLSILSQDTLRAAHRLSNTIEPYDATRGLLTGVTPLSYVAGALPTVLDERVSTNLLVGNFGPEVGLLVDAASRQQAFTLAASDALPAQAVLFHTADETLIGEELFALPAYLHSGPMHQASLRVQDILRWVIIALLVVVAVLTMAGIVTL